MQLQAQERHVVATHEAGHALAGWLLAHTDRVLKVSYLWVGAECQVSIIPRAHMALGYTQSLPGDQMLLSKEHLDDRMCMLLAGRAAEQIVYKTVRMST